MKIKKAIYSVVGAAITLAMKALFPAFLIFCASIPVYLIILKLRYG